MPNIFMLAGPNGAGKSTTARTLLPLYLNFPEFVNADDIARGLSGFHPENVAFQAGRLMLARLNELARQRVDFAFETTLASRSFALGCDCDRARDMSFIFFISVFRALNWLLSGWPCAFGPEDTMCRQKTSAGATSEAEIIFFEIYMSLANTWEVYDTASIDPKLVAFGGRDKQAVIVDPSLWGSLTERP